MKSEGEIKREARLMAIERLLCLNRNLLIAVIMKDGMMTSDQINAQEDEMLEALRLQPVPNQTPQTSDMLADEACHHFSTLIHHARALREEP